MFQARPNTPGPGLTLTGQRGAFVWGYHTAALCVSWRMGKRPQGHWHLDASCRAVDAFQCRQPDVMFVVPRKGGHWLFPVQALTIDGLHITARLGPIEA